MGIGRASGKLLLFGEHAAVYGHPALGVALPYHTEVSITRTRQGGRRTAGVPERFRAVVLDLIDYVDRSPDLPEVPECACIEVSSKVPPESGLGSSAALCAAVTRALSPRATEAMAHSAERFFHGTPSGIDTALALGGGIQALYPAPPALPRSRPLELHGEVSFVVGSFPRTSSTKKLVEAVRRKVESGSTATIGRLEELGRISAEAIALFQGGSESIGGAVGALADRAHQILAHLGFVVPQMDEAIRLARSFGSVGGKLSGAGGGGAFYVVFEDQERAVACRDGLRLHMAERGIPGTIHDAFVVTGCAAGRLGSARYRA